MIHYLEVEHVMGTYFVKQNWPVANRTIVDLNTKD